MVEKQADAARVEPIVMLRFVCEPINKQFSKAAPRLPCGVNWQLGMKYDAEEFKGAARVVRVTVDADGNVDVWLENDIDEGHSGGFQEFYAEFGWST